MILLDEQIVKKLIYRYHACKSEPLQANVVYMVHDLELHSQRRSYVTPHYYNLDSKEALIAAFTSWMGSTDFSRFEELVKEYSTFYILGDFFIIKIWRQ
jgi:hypothetical protein